MKKEYKVKIELFSYVDANSKEEAENKVDDMIRSQEIVLDNPDIIAKEVVPKGNGTVV